MMLYVPNYENNQCVVVNNNQTFRVYEEVPRYNSSIAYTDYYFNGHYIEYKGTQNFGNYSTLPVCRSSDSITTNWLYRNDLSDILISFVLLAFITLYPVYFAFKRFNRGRKVF